MHYVPYHYTSNFYVCITFPITAPVIATYALRSLLRTRFAWLALLTVSPHLFFYVWIIFSFTTPDISTYATFPVTNTFAATYEFVYPLLDILLPHKNCTNFHHTSNFYVCTKFPVTTPVIATFALSSLSPHQLFVRMHFVIFYHTRFCYVCNSFPGSESYTVCCLQLVVTVVMFVVCSW